jgi:hypothetical protein
MPESGRRDGSSTCEAMGVHQKLNLCTSLLIILAMPKPFCSKALQRLFYNT